MAEDRSVKGDENASFVDYILLLMCTQYYPRIHILLTLGNKTEYYCSLPKGRLVCYMGGRPQISNHASQS